MLYAQRTIQIVNQSTVVSAADLAACVAAVQIQLNAHLQPAWGVTAELVIGPDVAGERIYVLDDSDQAGALGYHEDETGGVPVGFVFAKTSIAAGEHWTGTFSHEAMEQTVDPSCLQGFVPPINSKQCFLPQEVGDPVENDEYQIAGVWVSNWVLPTWWQAGLPAGTRYDFLGNLSSALTLSPGGYFAYTSNLKSWFDVFGQKTPAHQRTIAKFSRRSRIRARHKVLSRPRQRGA